MFYKTHTTVSTRLFLRGNQWRKVYKMPVNALYLYCKIQDTLAPSKITDLVT